MLYEHDDDDNAKNSSLFINLSDNEGLIMLLILKHENDTEKIKTQNSAAESFLIL